MIDKKKILFIINPISGVGKKNKIPKGILKHLDLDKFEYDLAFTNYKKHGYEISLTEKHNYDIIVAIGGDGTVNEIGSALVNSKCILGIIPSGSGNGIARHLKIPRSIKKSIKRLNELDTVTMDTGTVNDHIFIGTCGFGFDSHIAQKFDEFHKRGLASYIKLINKEYFHFKNIRYSINFKGEKDNYKMQAIMCSVANTSQFGNGFNISPFSKVDDGQFEIVFIKKIKYNSAPKLLRQIFSKKIHKSKHFNQTNSEKAFSIELMNQTTPLFHIDGEPLKSDTNIFEIKINQKSLTVIH